MEHILGRPQRPGAQRNAHCGCQGGGDQRDPSDGVLREGRTSEQRLRATGRLLIGTRWASANKRDLTNAKVRSRLVAQELNLSKQPELFAATPSIEYVRHLVSHVVWSQFTCEPARLMVQDVEKTYVYAPGPRRYT